MQQKEFSTREQTSQKGSLMVIGQASYGVLTFSPASDVGKALSIIFEREAAAAVPEASTSSAIFDDGYL